MLNTARKPNEPKDPETCNIFSLHKLFSQDQLEEIANRYRKGKISYKESKEILAKNINKFLGPIRKKKIEIDKNPEVVFEVLKKGQKAAQKVASKTLSEIKLKVGIRI